MTDKYQQPPVPPGFDGTKEMTEFEKKIAEAFPRDPRKDDGAKAEQAASFVETPNQFQVRQDQTDLFHPRVDSQASQLLAELDELGEFAAGLEEDEEGNLRLKDGTLTSMNEVMSHNSREQQALEDMLADPNDFQVSLSSPKKPTPAKDAQQEPLPSGEKEETTKPIETAEEFFKMLDKHGLNEEDALSYLLANEKPLTEKARTEIWQSEVKASGFTEQEVLEAIRQYLTAGHVSLDFNIMNGMLRFSMATREPWVDRMIDTELVKAMTDQGNLLPELQENRIRFLWKIAGSLVNFNGFGESLHNRGATPDTIQERIRWIDAQSALTFEVLTKGVAKLDSLTYLASQRIAIENF